QFKDVKHVDQRTDIYALGCMLYAFVTGKPPFLGETYVEMFEAKEKGKFEPARKHNEEVPPKLDLFLDKAMSKKLELRYHNCADLVAALESLGLANEALSFLQPEGAKPAAAKPGSKPPASPPTAAPKSRTIPSAPPGSSDRFDDAPPGTWF